MKYNRAFSLVEVTIALGIVSVALIAAVGVIPHGLTIMRQARDQTTEAQIVREVIGQASLTSFSQLEQYVGNSPFYYTDVAQSQDRMDDQTRFEVRLSLETAVYPGSSSTDVSPHLKTLVVETYKVAGGVHQKTTKDVVTLPNSGL